MKSAPIFLLTLAAVHLAACGGEDSEPPPVTATLSETVMDFTEATVTFADNGELRIDAREPGASPAQLTLIVGANQAGTYSCSPESPTQITFFSGGGAPESFTTQIDGSCQVVLESVPAGPMDGSWRGRFSGTLGGGSSSIDAEGEIALVWDERLELGR